MDTEKKLELLTETAKYDASCSSSSPTLSSGLSGGLCHSFSSDGRCVSLLKVLFTNVCIYDCEYCINRRSNDIKRASFSPKELADVVINFYKRNYIEGLFLSSGIVQNPDFTMELLLKTVRILRKDHDFKGYIHLKIIPGSSPELIEEASKLADRVSSNIELPSEQSLKALAPEKSKDAVIKPMELVKNFKENYKNLASMTTQLIVGATKESDYEILRLSSYFYNKKLLKRVYYSAYIPVNESSKLPSLDTKPPLLREHRLYQADWLLRFYGFTYKELLKENQNLDLRFDPKTVWALNNLYLFPIDINKAPYELLIRVPGIGIRSALKIINARKFKKLYIEDLEKLGVSLKKSKYFIEALSYFPKKLEKTFIENSLATIEKVAQKPIKIQLSLWK